MKQQHLLLLLGFAFCSFLYCCNASVIQTPKFTVSGTIDRHRFPNITWQMNNHSTYYSATLKYLAEGYINSTSRFSYSSLISLGGKWNLSKEIGNETSYIRFYQANPSANIGSFSMKISVPMGEFKKSSNFRAATIDLYVSNYTWLNPEDDHIKLAAEWSFDSNDKDFEHSIKTNKDESKLRIGGAYFDPGIEKAKSGSDNIDVSTIANKTEDGVVVYDHFSKNLSHRIDIGFGSDSNKISSHSSMIVGIIIALVILLIVAAVLGFVIIRRRRRAYSALS